MTTGNMTPTTTVTPARVRLFQPSQRPINQVGNWIQTSWGKCRVSGRLGQRHADLIESILFVAEKTKHTDDGAIMLLVDPAQLRRAISDQGYCFEQIWKLIEETRKATFEIESPKFRIFGGLIDHVVKSKRTKKNPLGGERHLWNVRLGLPLSELLHRDVPLFYDPRPICRLNNGISQAVARHVLTHQILPQGGWDLDTLIHTVAGKLEKMNLRNARRNVREDARGLQEMGIIIDGSRITRVASARRCVPPA